MSNTHKSNCPSCKRFVHLWGHRLCTSCTPKKEWKSNRQCQQEIEDNKTTAEVMSEFYKSGFQ